jgi:hypothetical protein
MSSNDYEHYRRSKSSVGRAANFFLDIFKLANGIAIIFWLIFMVYYLIASIIKWVF